jgi:hypothetical protein
MRGAGKLTDKAALKRTATPPPHAAPAQGTGGTEERSTWQSGLASVCTGTTGQRRGEEMPRKKAFVRKHCATRSPRVVLWLHLEAHRCDGVRVCAGVGRAGQPGLALPPCRALLGCGRQHLSEARSGPTQDT